MAAPISAEPISADETVARSGLRKASLRLLPLVAVGYGIAYMDRVNISFASLQMNRDLHFSATVYGLGAGLFFISYAACEVPSNLLLCRFGARRWLARIMITWGIIAVAMMLVKTPGQFYTARFLLGMAEAGFFPGVVFYLMQWFPPELRARTISRFYVAIPLASVFMGSIAGALLNLNGKLGLAGWQWLFLIEALPAIILGVIYLAYLPDRPADATWLTEPERNAFLARVPANAIQINDPILPALRDPRVLLLGIFMFCMLGSNYAYIFSSPAILQKATGLSVTNVGFIIAAMNLGGAASMILNSLYSDRHKAPFAHVIPGCIVMSLGFLITGSSSSAASAIIGLTLLYLGNYSLQGPLWAISTAFLSGRSAAAAIAAMNTIGILGGFVGPYWMGFAKDLTGDYQRGLLLTAPFMLIGAAILLYIRKRATPAASKYPPATPSTIS